jgi:hypothetical protein
MLRIVCLAAPLRGSLARRRARAVRSAVEDDAEHELGDLIECRVGAAGGPVLCERQVGEPGDGECQLLAGEVRPQLTAAGVWGVLTRFRPRVASCGRRVVCPR